MSDVGDLLVQCFAELIRRGQAAEGPPVMEGAPSHVRTLLAAYASHCRSLSLGEWEIQSLCDGARDEVDRAGGCPDITADHRVLHFGQTGDVSLVVVFLPGAPSEEIYALDFEYQSVRGVAPIAKWLQSLVEGTDHIMPSWGEVLEAARDEEGFDKYKLDRLPELRLLLAEKVEQLRGAGESDTADSIQLSLDIFREEFGSLHIPWKGASLTG